MKCIVLLFYSAHYSTYSTCQQLILAYKVTGSRTLILCNVQITMQFKLFNATTMHNSTEKCKKSKNPIEIKKKSDLNFKK